MSDPYGPPADQPSPYQRPPAPYQQTSYEPVPLAYVEQPAAKPPTSPPPPEQELSAMAATAMIAAIVIRIGRRLMLPCSPRDGRCRT